ncbi:putative O-antigen polymerase [Moritella yayanosii]|uniref:Putative O-antigen polymerase n=2 Tax=Moritella yayanosii TaxID=69539 RepID=A0A330LUY4_9GAMM|nr:putative O-antigen polymerase [Moritella yayanosii]
MLFLMLFLIFLLLVASYEFYFGLNKNYRLIIIMPVIYILYFLAGFNITSPDYINYVDMINGIGGINEFFDTKNMDYKEPVFSLLIVFLNSLFDDVQIVYSFISLLSISITVYVLFKRSPLLFLSMALYFAHPYLNKEVIQIRAGLATAFVLLGASFLMDKKKKSSYLSFLLAVGSHFSAIIVIVPLIVIKFIGRKKIVKFVLFSLVLCLYLNMISFHKILFDILLGYEILPPAVAGYINWDEYNYSLGLMNPMLIKLLFILFVIHVYFRQSILENNLVYVSYVFLSFSACWLILFADIAIFAARITSITSVLELIIIPYIIFHLKLKPRIQFFPAVLYCFIMLFINIYIKKMLDGFSFGIL